LGAVGACFAGQLGVTSSSVPGIALKTESIGLAISTELPLVIIDVQRAGPSTGLPTKTEQSDLHQAVWGRNGDAPIVVLATSNPHDCFDVGIEAVRLATKYMTPVMVLSDGYIGNASEPWRIPDINTLDKFSVKYCTDPEGFHPFKRDPETLARVWAKPGTPDCLHRIGGIEKDYDTGHISYEPGNHQKMTDVRAAKIAGVANDIPEQEVSLGTSEGKLAVVGWGSTRGSIHHAVKRARAENIDVSHIHISKIWTIPRNLKNLLNRFDKDTVAEKNKGQMNNLLRDEYLLDGHSLTKVSGQPFKITESLDCIRKQAVEIG